MARRENTRTPHRDREQQRDECARQLRRQRRWQRAQTLVIFALSLTVLLGFAGLAVDVMRVFDLYAREQRAAEAGALAGVLYMPSFYDTASTAPADGNSAVSRAMLEAVKDGFGTAPGGPVVANACPANRATVPVAVCQVALGGGAFKQTDLQVTVSQTTPIFLLSAVGIQSATISASAQAEYLPQVQMGSRLNYFGDGAYNLQNFRAVANGQGDLAEFGDPYVACEQGPDTATTYPPPTPDGGYYTDSVGVTTDHPEFGSPLCGSNKGPSDKQPFGYTGPATASTSNPGAHNYAINVSAADANGTVYVWNGNFVPGQGNLDHFQSGSQNIYGNLTLTNGNYDDPSLYSNLTYTLYSVKYLFLRSGDTVQTGPVVFKPYDNVSADLTAHGCLPGEVYDPQRGNSTYSGLPITVHAGCVLATNLDNGNCMQQWCPIGNVGGPGLYRLTVEVSGLTDSGPPGWGSPTQGWGSHRYALEICSPGVAPSTGGPCSANPGTTLAAWNNMTVFYGVTGTTSTFDLGQIPTAYAGRQINVGLFDPGDANGDVYMQIIPPAGSNASVSVPANIRQGAGAYTNMIWANCGGCGNDKLYNGLWINTLVTLPPNYDGTASGGWWQLKYITTGSTSDTVSVSFSLVGAPVHLVPLG